MRLVSHHRFACKILRSPIRSDHAVLLATRACCRVLAICMFEGARYGLAFFARQQPAFRPVALWAALQVGLLGAVPAAAGDTGAAGLASPAKVYGYRDGKGKMVFTDKASVNATEIPLTQPTVVEGSKLGLKAYARQQPVSLEQIEASEASARRAADKQRERDWMQEDRQRQRCERLRQIVSNSQYGTPVFRAAKQRQYDTECVQHGF